MRPRLSERRLKGRYQLQSVLGRGLATATHLALDHPRIPRLVDYFTEEDGPCAFSGVQTMSRPDASRCRMGIPDLD